MDIELVDIKKIIPYARNPRIHKDAGIAKIAASIKEYGFRQPIVVDAEYVIIAGYARYLAAEKIQMEKVPVHRATTLSASQVKAYRIADNRTHEESAWDGELLLLELLELEEKEYSLQNTAFDMSELDKLLNSSPAPICDENTIPALTTKTIVQYGDIWQLGNHRLVCGSAAEIESYTALLGSGKVDMVYTDPPYNVNYEGKAGKIANDKLPHEEFYKLLYDSFSCLHQVMKQGAPIYVSYGEKETETFYRTLRESGFQQSSNLIWLKNQLVLGRGDYHCKHEPIWYGWKAGGKHPWYGGRKKVTVNHAFNTLPLTLLDNDRYMLQWSDLHVILSGTNISVEVVEDNLIFADKPQRSELHPTMKPVCLIEELVKNSSARGDVVLDAFGGSGSTLIACEKSSRHARIIELSPSYCDVIIRRWQDYTGEIAAHAITAKRYGEE